MIFNTILKINNSNKDLSTFTIDKILSLLFLKKLSFYDNHFDNDLDLQDTSQSDLFDSTIERSIDDFFIKILFLITDHDIEFLHQIREYIQLNTNYHSYFIFYFDININSDRTSEIKIRIGLPMLLKDKNERIYKFHHIPFSNKYELLKYFNENESIIDKNIFKIFIKYYEKD